MLLDVVVRGVHARKSNSTLKVPGPVCFNLKFSSLNDFPNIDFPPVPLWSVKSPPCDGQEQQRCGSKFQLSVSTLCVRDSPDT